MIVRGGKTFDNGDVQIAMFGSIDYEVTKIAYGTSQAHTPNYALGSNKPSSYSKGKIENKCTLGLRFKSISQLEKAAGGSLLNVKPFKITVAFVDDENEMVVDVITAKFADQGRDVGDSDDLKKEFELFCLDIQYNVTGL